MKGLIVVINQFDVLYLSLLRSISFLLQELQIPPANHKQVSNNGTIDIVCRMKTELASIDYKFEPLENGCRGTLRDA